MNFRIKEIRARQVFDSRANPTVEVDVILENGVLGRGIVPSGASTGRFEAHELKDNDSAHFAGKGVRRAVSNVETVLAPALVGMDASDQTTIDKLLVGLDGTMNKSSLGANALLGCSLACAYAAANAKRVPLFEHLGSGTTIPVPMIQMIGGGAHAEDSIDIQDFLVIPMSAHSFAEGFEMAVKVYNAVREIYRAKGKPLSVADEGGFWPAGFKRNDEGLDIIAHAIDAAGYRPMEDVAIALDIASSEFYDEEQGLYELKLENRRLDAGELVELYEDWVGKYPIISIEDGCAESDWEGSALLTKRLGRKIQIIGDDLFTTNIGRIAKGVELGACNSVLIKMNQIGTLTETLETVEYTLKKGMLPVISARSGETEDSSIVHLAIATGAGQLKVGSVVRGERTAKWNEVIRMEEYLGENGSYSGGIYKRFFE